MAQRAEVLQDDAQALHVRLYPTNKVTRVLGWLPWMGILALYIYSASFEGPKALIAALPFIALWMWFAAADLAYGLNGWEEIVVTARRVVVCRKVFHERVVADVSASEVTVVRVRERPFFEGKNDQRRLAVVMRDGAEHHFAQKLDDPATVAQAVTERLRSESRPV